MALTTERATTAAEPEQGGGGPARRRIRLPRRIGRPGKLTYMALGGWLLISAFPIYWSGMAASQTNAALGAVPPVLVPGSNLWKNIVEVFDTADFGLALMNSVIVSSVITVCVVFFSTLAGFAFAKLKFRGRNAMLLFVIATMMVPTQLGVVPMFMLMNDLGWTDELQAVIVPSMVSAFGVFFMRQYLSEALPIELLEAGRVDGCSTFRLFWNIALPVARPAAAVLGMLTFMQAWNDFFWPLIVLTPGNPTVQVAISTLASGTIIDFPVVLTGALLAILPLLVIFGLLGKHIIGGIMAGAVKG